MARIPVDPAETLRLIEQYDRSAFQDQLAYALGVRPGLKALQAFVNKYPDRHAQAVTMWARLCGYSEAPAVSVSVQVKVQALSDAQLAKELASAIHKLHQLEQAALPPASSQPIDSIAIDADYHRSPILSHPTQEATEQAVGGGGAAPGHADPEYPPPHVE